MTEKELKRLLVVQQVDKGLMTVREAAITLGLSERQVYRIIAKVRERGEAGVIHGNRGRRPKHALSDKLKQRVIDLSISKYPGSNDCHFADTIKEYEGICLSVSSVRRIRRAAGIASPRKRRRRRLHHPRKRKAQEGMLLQIDASHHDWLQGRGAKIALHGAIDDATGKVVAAVFRPQETLEGYFTVMRQVLTKYGIPYSLYSDRHSIFISPKDGKLSLEEELAGIAAPLSQFGKAMAQLGIAHIKALSPQAKGRIERLWQTFQDRLIVEMSWHNIATIQDAQVFLERFIERYNARFAVQPENPEPVYRPVPESLDLDYLLCQRVQRKVLSGNCIAYQNRCWRPLCDGQPAYLPKGAAVQVLIPITGLPKLVYKGNVYDLEPLPERPSKQAQPTAPKTQKPRPKPSPNHPWRRSFSKRRIVKSASASTAASSES